MDKLENELDETNQKIREARAKVDQQRSAEYGTRQTKSNTVEQAVLKLDDRKIVVTFIYVTESVLVELRDQEGRPRSVRFGLYTLKDQQMEIRWLKYTAKTKPPELVGRERGNVRFGWIGRNYTIQEHPDPTMIGKSLNFTLMKPLDHESFQVFKMTALETRQRYFDTMEKKVRARADDLRKEWEKTK